MVTGLTHGGPELNRDMISVTRAHTLKNEYDKTRQDRGVWTQFRHHESDYDSNMGTRLRQGLRDLEPGCDLRIEDLGLDLDVYYDLKIDIKTGGWKPTRWQDSRDFDSHTEELVLD